MSLRSALGSLLLLPFLACVAEPIDVPASVLASELDPAADSTVEPASVATDIGIAEAECRRIDSCTPAGGARDCEWIGDVDCGGTFCRTPGVQCDAQPSTFQRVEHWYQCTRPSGGECYITEIGRWLVACGC